MGILNALYLLKGIGMEMSELSVLVREAGFVEIGEFPNLECRTKPVRSRAEFLRQYFEGSLAWLGKDEKAWRQQFKKLAKSRDLSRIGRGEDGNIQFDITMHAILARKSKE
jgi:hypothetical protein